MYVAKASDSDDRPYVALAYLFGMWYTPWCWNKTSMPRRAKVEFNECLAWLAGIVDGEGTIAITKTGNYFQHYVSVGNTSTKIIEMVDSLFSAVSGRGHISTHTEGDRIHKSAWIVRVSSRPSVHAVVSGVLPYLVTKIDQGQLAIRSLEMGCTGDHFEAMRMLNQRGPLGRVRSSSQGLQHMPMNQRLAWLGGIVDGEGSLTLGLVRARAAQNKSGFSQLARFEVHIANTNENMLEEIMDISRTNGIGCCWVRGKPRPTERPTHRVVWLGMPRCQALLRLVRPYLVAKGQHADVMLKAIEHRQVSQRTKSGYGHSAVVDDGVLIDLLQDLKRLNARGICSEPVPDQFTHVVARQGSELVSRGRGAG